MAHGLPHPSWAPRREALLAQRRLEGRDKALDGTQLMFIPDHQEVNAPLDPSGSVMMPKTDSSEGAESELSETVLNEEKEGEEKAEGSGLVLVAYTRKIGSCDSALFPPHTPHTHIHHTHTYAPRAFSLSTAWYLRVALAIPPPFLPLLDLSSPCGTGTPGIFSGTLRRGQKINVLGARYDPRRPAGPQRETQQCCEASVDGIYLLMGRDLVPVEEAPAGSIVGVTGLGPHVLKTATLSTTLACPSFTSLLTDAKPIVSGRSNGPRPAMPQLLKPDDPHLLLPHANRPRDTVRPALKSCSCCSPPGLLLGCAGHRRFAWLWKQSASRTCRRLRRACGYSGRQILAWRSCCRKRASTL